MANPRAHGRVRTPPPRALHRYNSHNQRAHGRVRGSETRDLAARDRQTRPRARPRQHFPADEPPGQRAHGRVMCAKTILSPMFFRRRSFATRSRSGRRSASTDINSECRTSRGFRDSHCIRASRGNGLRDLQFATSEMDPPRRATCGTPPRPADGHSMWSDSCGPVAQKFGHLNGTRGEQETG